MLYMYDYTNQIIDIPAGIDSVLVQTLINDIRDAEATEQGVAYGRIATASGKEFLGADVNVGVTVALLDSWQIRFASGNYIAKVTGGNLVGGLGGDPIAYSPGVQVLLVQSAASTVVNQSGTAPADLWSYIVDGGYTAEQVLRIMASALAGKVSGAAGTGIVFRDLADTRDRISATVDSSGNRSGVTLDVS